MGLAIILLLSFFPLISLFNPMFFPIHDDTQIARVFEMGEALKDGMFPVRWVPDLGYGFGYPIFNFYAPGAYYFGALFTFFGFDALVATEIMIGVGFLLAGVFMYFLGKEFFGNIGGFITSVFYIFAPYHAVNIYVRGAVAELWAYALIPLAFLGFYKVFQSSIGDSNYEENEKLQFKIKNSVWKWIIVGSLGYAGVVLSHNLTALMVTPFIIIVIFLCSIAALRRKSPFIIYYLLLTILLGLSISAFYSVPALSEMKYTNVVEQIGGSADFREHFVCPIQLWENYWGFGGSVPGCKDGMSFRIGRMHIFFVFLGTFFALYCLISRRLNVQIKVAFLSIIVFFSAVFLMLSQSGFVWEFVPAMAFLQYPWRFLNIVVFASSLLTGFAVWYILEFLRKRYPNKEFSYIIVFVICAILLQQNLNLFQQRTIVKKTAEDFTNEKALKWEVSKTSDEYMPKDFYKPKTVYEISKQKMQIASSGYAKVEKIEDRTHTVSAIVVVEEIAKLKIALAHFPSWRIFIDDKETNFEVVDDGYIVMVPNGKHYVAARFVQTPVEKIANLVSLVGALVLFAGIITSRKKGNH